jgi:hypothetical protein
MTQSSPRALFTVLFLALGVVFAGCVSTKFVSSTPAAASRPGARMTQTDFLVRVVNYSCQISGCTDVGQRNANLGSPGVRQTILDMCWVHMQQDSASDRGPQTKTCFDRATMSIGDPGLSQVWSDCVGANNANGWEVQCYSAALSELVEQGKDFPITALIPGALTDTGVAGVAEAPGAGPAGGTPGPAVAIPAGTAPSCAEWLRLLPQCDGDLAIRQVPVVAKLPEADCAKHLPMIRTQMTECAKSHAKLNDLKLPPSAPTGEAKGPTGERLLVSAGGIDARLSTGMLVVELVRGSGAYNAGLRPGDVVTMVNGQTATVNEWAKAHQATGLGGTLKATVKQGKKLQDIEWTVAKCDDPSCQCTGKMCTRKGDTFPRQITGMRLAGTRVEEVLDGPARAAGIQVGDMIVSVNEIPLRDVYSMIEIVGQLQAGSVVNVVFSRAGKEEKTSLKLIPAP